MSFLNPVNEPVKRFKSTDTGAPQINYNARVAGDVKAVLKACLVTGYGATASAGWSIVNEVDHVAEFVSPAVAMSDYRLGIDDTSTSSTTWYYQFKDARTNPSYNAPVKSLGNSNKAHPSNGWQLLATEQGIIFIELIQHGLVNKLSTRITYWGAVKSGLSNTTGKNICFFNIGHDAAIIRPQYFYSSAGYSHAQLETNASAYIIAATSGALSSLAYTLDTSIVDLISPIYLASSGSDMLIGELPPMLSKIVNKTNDVYGISDFTLDGRSMFAVTAGYATGLANQAYPYSRSFLIRTDYWEY